MASPVEQVVVILIVIVCGPIIIIATGTSPGTGRAMARDTRDRIIEAAGRLLREKGYRGTGLSEIIERSGAPRGSIYFHFPDGKEQIVREAMVREVDRITEVLITLTRESSSPVSAVRAYVEGAADELEASNYLFGCPVAPVILDLPDPGSALAEACRVAVDEWCGIYVEALTGAGVSPDRARSLAIMAVSAVEGALLLSRAYRDVAPLRRVADELERLIEGALPESVEA
jgi:TetR/AcrR family transcriptional repressor of lmrAB and yxaGH operons